MRGISFYTNKKGSTLMLVIVVLLAVTILGVTMSMLSTSQINMNAALKYKEIALYNCDSCTVTINKLMRHVVDQSNEGNVGIAAGSALAPGISYASSVTGLDPAIEFAHRVLFGLQTQGCEDVQFASQAIAANVAAASNGNVTIAINELDAAADIRSKIVTTVPGNPSREFAGGANQGLGDSGVSGGGTALKFIIACRGRAPYNAVHVGYSVYRKTLGVGKGE